MRKISGLFKGRRGISIQIGIELYQALVRPHLEHAAPVWAGITTNKWKQLERVQHQCKKKIIGAHSCSASNATEVLCQVMPIEYRIRELSIREYSKIMGRPNDDYLKTLLTNARSIRNNFTPLSYLKSASKALCRRLDAIGASPETPDTVNPTDLINQVAPYQVEVVKEIGNSKTRTEEQKATGKDAIGASPETPDTVNRFD